VIIRKFQAKTEKEATEAAVKELGSSVVIMNVKTTKPKGFFSFLKPAVVEVTAAVEEESDNPQGKSDNSKSQKNEEAKNDAPKSLPKTEKSFPGVIPDEVPEKKSDDKVTVGQDIEAKLESIHTLIEERLNKEDEAFGEKNGNDKKDSAEKNHEIVRFLKLIYNTLIENEVDAKFDFDYEDIAKKVINTSMDLLKFPFEAEISLTITDANGIQAINKEFRDIDSATDVLSFPMVEYESAGIFDKIEADEDLFNPETGEVILGDIVLCKERIYSQAEEYGHSVLREYAFLIAHSMLHLFGFDHMTEDEAAVMEEKQREILDALGISRD